MFAARYFAPRYFAPRYWPSVGAESAAIDAPGLHWRITGSPMHYTAGGSRMDYKPPGTPLHYLDDEP